MSRLGKAERWEQGLAGSGRSPRLVVETRRPPGPFTSIAWSADGRLLAAAGAVGDRGVKLWTVRDVMELRSLPAADDAITAIAFSPDAKRLVGGTAAGTLVVWDVNSGRLRRRIDAHTSSVQFVQFDIAGDTLMTSSHAGAVDVRDGRTGRRLRSVEGPTASYGIVALSPDGRQLLLADGGKMSLLSAEADRPLRSLDGHEIDISALAFSHDGGTIVSGDVSGGVRLWSASSGKALRTLAPSTSIDLRSNKRRRRSADEILSLGWSPDGNRLAVGTVGGIVVLWNPNRSAPLGTIDAFVHCVWSLGFSPDSRFVAAAGGMERAVKLWNVQRGRGAPLNEPASLIALGESEWAAVTPDDSFDASPGAARYMFWLDKDRQPIPLETFLHQRSDQLIPRLLATGSTPPSCTGRLRRPRRAEDDETPAASAWRSRTQPSAAVTPALTVRTNPTNGIASVALSDDGELLASGSADMSIQLWDTSLGREIRTLRGHTDVVTSLAFVDGSALLASGSRDGTVRLWDVRSGLGVDQIPIGLPAHRVTITPSADGKLFLCASNDGAVRMVHAGTGRVLHSARILEEWPSGQRYILSEQVAVSPDGRIVVRPHDRDRVTALDLRTGQVLYEFGSQDTPGAIAFDRRGQRLAVGGATSRQLIVIGGTGTSQGDSGLPRHTYRIELRASGTGKLLHALVGHSANVTALAFSPKGKLLGSGSEDGTVRLWDMRSGKERRRLTTESGAVLALAFDARGRTISSGEFTAPFAGRVTRWQVASSKPLARFERPIGDVNPVCFSPDGRSIAAGGEDGHIQLWTFDRQSAPRLLLGHRDRVFSLDFSPDGRQLVSACWDGTSRLWDVSSGEAVALLDEETQRIWHSTFSCDGRFVATCRHDGTVCVWQVSPRERRFVLRRRAAARRERPRLTDVNSAALCAAFSPDGQVLAIGYGDDQVVVWHLSTQQEVRAFDAHELGVSSVSFDPTGSMLVTGGLDQSVALWKRRNGHLIRRMTGHATPGHIEKGTSARFTSDGKSIASGGTDGTVRLWDAASGRMLSVIEAHAGAVASIAFDPGNAMLAAASNDASVSLWDVRVPEKPEKHCALYAFPDGSWAVIDGRGRFDASDGGQIEWLHWVVGLDIVALDQLKERYYEPGLLAKVLGFSDDALRDVPALSEVRLHPQLQRVAESADGTRSRLRLTNRGGGIGRVEVLLNGKEVRADARGDGFDSAVASHEIELDLTDHPFLVSGQDNTCTVRAYNAEGYLVGRDVGWTVSGPRKGPEPPHLWAIIAGVSGYSGPALSLRFAAKDAEDVAAAVRLAAAGLFSADRVHQRLLTSPYRSPSPVPAWQKSAASAAGSERPTRQRLSAAFEAVKKAAPSDILLVYLAGHGVNYGGSDGDYFFLTADARTSDLTDPAVRQQTAISSRELTDWIKAVPALKQVLVLDTCAAGRFVENLSEHRALPSSQQRAFERMKDRTGIHILAGSTADAVSYESSQYGQGVLTYSLLLGMRGAALRDDEFVDVARLFAYATDAVPKLAAFVGGIQRPLTSTPRGGTSFDIGRVGSAEREQIPMAMVRPLTLRAELEETASWYDSQGLGRAVNSILREESARGRDAPLIFIDAAEYPGAYQVKGRYSVAGNSVNVQIRVMCVPEVVLDTALTGPLDAPDHMASSIAAVTIEAVRSHFGGHNAPA
jgi:WD40 repeat protein/uncharacterized caspase-like protein